MKKEDIIMFWITGKEFDEITGIISKYCCGCSGAYCSEADCDVHDIYEILYQHVDTESTEEEEKLPFDLEEYDELL